MFKYCKKKNMLKFLEESDERINDYFLLKKERIILQDCKKTWICISYNWNFKKTKCIKKCIYIWLNIKIA